MSGKMSLDPKLKLISGRKTSVIAIKTIGDHMKPN